MNPEETPEDLDTTATRVAEVATVIAGTYLTVKYGRKLIRKMKQRADSKRAEAVIDAVLRDSSDYANAVKIVTAFHPDIVIPA